MGDVVKKVKKENSTNHTLKFEYTVIYKPNEKESTYKHIDDFFKEYSKWYRKLDNMIIGISKKNTEKNYNQSNYFPIIGNDLYDYDKIKSKYKNIETKCSHHEWFGKKNKETGEVEYIDFLEMIEQTPLYNQRKYPWVRLYKRHIGYHVYKNHSKDFGALEYRNSQILDMIIRNSKNHFLPFDCNEYENKKIKLNKKIYGGYKNFEDRSKGKITSEEFKENRLVTICSYGDKSVRGGNSLFNYIDFDEFHVGINRPGKKGGVDFKLQLKPNKNYAKILKQLRPFIKGIVNESQYLNSETNPNNKKIPITITLNKKHVTIVYDIDSIQQYDNVNYKTSNIIASIDINPQNIGLAIIDMNGNTPKILLLREYNFYEISKKTKTKNKLASYSPEQIKLNNKFSNSLYEINKNMVNIMSGYGVTSLYMEDLDNIFKTKNSKGGAVGNFKDSDNLNNYEKKSLNSVVNNSPTKKILSNIKIRANKRGIKTYYINPNYTSFIGNAIYNYTDAVNASIFIGLTGYWTKVFEKLNPNIEQYDNWGDKVDGYDENGLKNKYYMWTPNLNSVSLKPKYHKYIGLTHDKGFTAWVAFYNSVQKNSYKPECPECKKYKDSGGCWSHRNEYRVKLSDPDIEKYHKFELHGDSKRPTGVFVYEFINHSKKFPTINSGFIIGNKKRSKIIKVEENTTPLIDSDSNQQNLNIGIRETLDLQLPSSENIDKILL